MMIVSKRTSFRSSAFQPPPRAFLAVLLLPALVLTGCNFFGSRDEAPSQQASQPAPQQPSAAQPAAPQPAQEPAPAPPPAAEEAPASAPAQPV